MNKIFMLFLIVFLVSTANSKTNKFINQVAIWKTHSKFFTDIGLANNRDSASNGILVPDSCNKAQSMRRFYYHCGSHGIYNGKVELYVAKIEDDFRKKRITIVQAKEKVKNLQDDLRKYVGQSSSTPHRLN